MKITQVLGLVVYSFLFCKVNMQIHCNMQIHSTIIESRVEGHYAKRGCYRAAEQPYSHPSWIWVGLCVCRTAAGQSCTFPGTGPLRASFASTPPSAGHWLADWLAGCRLSGRLYAWYGAKNCKRVVRSLISGGGRSSSSLENSSSSLDDLEDIVSGGGSSSSSLRRTRSRS